MGLKFDGGKPMPRLIPPHAALEVARVLEHGARKYGPDNWRLVERGMERYNDAALRHILEWETGRTTDPDSGAHPLAHAVCSLLFMLETELESTT